MVSWRASVELHAAVAEPERWFCQVFANKTEQVQSVGAGMKAVEIELLKDGLSIGGVEGATC